MTKKKQLILRPNKNIIEYEGLTFKNKTTKFKKIDGVEHIDKVIFEEVNLEVIDDQLNFIKNKLINKIPTERVIEEILQGISIKETNRIYKLLKKGAKIKRQDGCLGLKIDGGKNNNCYIQIFG